MNYSLSMMIMLMPMKWSFCEVLVNREVTDAWGATARLKYTRLRYELKIHRFVKLSGIDDLELFMNIWLH